jgi:hypothetical protein
MSEAEILTKSIVADYYEIYSNRHEDKTMPETVFYFAHGPEK